jgi:hypothetical protein
MDWTSEGKALTYGEMLKLNISASEINAVQGSRPYNFRHNWARPQISLWKEVNSASDCNEKESYYMFAGSANLLGGPYTYSKLMLWRKTEPDEPWPKSQAAR